MDGPTTSQCVPLGIRPHCLLQDRDRILGEHFPRQVQDMGIEQVLSGPRSPWQRAYIERIIGTVIVFNAAALYQQVKSFTEDYHRAGIAGSVAARPRTNCGDSASRRSSPQLRAAASLKTMGSSDCPRKRRARRFPAFHHCH
jgi:transposase InsO family protein